MDLNSTTSPDANAGSPVIILIPELGEISASLAFSYSLAEWMTVPCD
jgi:hypothetical protein